MKIAVAFIITSMLLILAVIVAGSILVLTGCSSAPTRTFNTEDKQDGSCYATYGSMLGYCSTNVIDVFNNNHIYDGAE